MGAIARRKGVGLFCNVEASVPPRVSADVDRIGHTLLRIAEAVVSAIDGGDLHLNLRAATFQDGTYLIFEIGSRSKMLSPVLFRGLRQDDFEFDGSLPGSGALGLAAARNLAIALAGHVDASADLSTGTRIAVTIPVAVAAGVAAQPQPGTETSPQAQQALRIPVPKASEDSFQMFRAYLQDHAHVV